MLRQLAIIGVILIVSSCFSRSRINENAIVQQKSCMDAIGLKDFERARTHCELCLEYDSSMPQCLNAIGLIALAANDEKKAVDFFSRALRQNNNFAEARNNIGVTYFAKGEFNKALVYFEKALSIDPANSDARNNCALSYFRLAERFRAKGDIKNSVKNLLIAKEHINKLLAVESSYANAYRDLGLIELNLYDLSEFDLDAKNILNRAEQAFNNCVSSDKNNSACFEGLGQVKTEQGLFEQAFAQYFMCLSHEPNNSSCRKGIVFAFEKSAQAEGGYQSFYKRINNSPANADAHEAFCAVLFERGLDTEAVKQCQLALKLQPNFCLAHYRLGIYYAAVLNNEQARNYCQQYLVCERSNPAEQRKRCQEIISRLKS